MAPQKAEGSVSTQHPPATLKVPLLQHQASRRGHANALNTPQNSSSPRKQNARSSPPPHTSDAGRPSVLR